MRHRRHGLRLPLGLIILCMAFCATPAVSAERAQDRKDWTAYGHDLSNTRLNPREHRINRRTVKRLTQSWSKDGLVGVTGTPTVAGKIAYFGDWRGVVWAVKAKTGESVWQTQIGGTIVGAPTIVGTAVYVASGAKLYRLNRATGAIEWQVVTNENAFAQINASPVFIDGLVLQGVASFEVTIPKQEYTFRGTIGAYDADTGDEMWRLYMTTADSASGAGVGVWSTPAVDRKRGTLYVGSGNTYAEPTAPLADSILAIDYKTGELKWSRQFTYPDVFSAGHPGGKDADVGASPNLWRARGRNLVGAGDKAGVYHALDRDTGEVVWETVLTPGSFLGGEIGSGAYVDGKLIVVSNAPMNVAKVFALNPATGDVLWVAEDYPGKIYAPVGAVPGVAFIGTDAGTMAALDTRTGEELWSFTAPARTGCGPSIVNGRVLWGYGFLFFGPPPPGGGGVISFVVGR